MQEVRVNEDENEDEEDEDADADDEKMRRREGKEGFLDGVHFSFLLRRTRQRRCSNVIITDESGDKGITVYVQVR